MTRINAFIKPEKLTDAHLVAEIKEINQLCGSYNKSKNCKTGISNLPNQFTLNTGHVKFFYNYGLYLKKRFYKLKKEAIKRNFNITADFNSSVWEKNHFNDFNPSINEKIRIQNILIDRISTRLSNQKSKIKYNSKDINSDKAIQILKNII